MHEIRISVLLQNTHSKGFFKHWKPRDFTCYAAISLLPLYSTTPCMVTLAFYTSTVLCNFSCNHNVLEWSVLLTLQESNPPYFAFLHPSPVRNQWQSMYYHRRLGPNKAKTEHLPYQCYTYLDTLGRTFTCTSNAHIFTPMISHTHTHTHTHRVTYAHMRCTLKRARHRRINILGK